jgi:hypothetical protein
MRQVFSAPFVQVQFWVKSHFIYAPFSGNVWGHLQLSFDTGLPAPFGDRASADAGRGPAGAHHALRLACPLYGKDTYNLYPPFLQFATSRPRNRRTLAFPSNRWRDYIIVPAKFTLNAASAEVLLSSDPERSLGRIHPDPHNLIARQAVAALQPRQAAAHEGSLPAWSVCGIIRLSWMEVPK